MSKFLQQNLVELGYGDIVGSIDGIVGANTINGVRQLQEDKGLVVDGIPGTKTRSAIYQWKKSAGKIGTRNFKIDEFRSPDDGSLPKNGMDSKLLLSLELLRWKLGGKPVVINSGYRTKAFNKQVGGIWNSNHLKGEAADIKVIGVSPKTVQMYAEQIFNGVGRYKNFTHVDTNYRKVHFVGKY